MRSGRLPPLVGLLLALAGCTAPAAEPAPVQPAQTPAEPAMGEFRLEGTSCLEGGGHSVHPRRYADILIPEPWVAADVLQDVGPQLTYSETPQDGVPEEGDTWGNYHATVVCRDWSRDGDALEGHVFGFVGARVEPQPFDPGPPAERHYIITVLATSDHALHEFLHAQGFHASMTKGTAEWRAEGLFHNLLDTEDHGVYESLFRTGEAGPMPGTMRLWYQKENGDGSFSPLALDMANTGGTHLWAEPNGYFSHLRTHDHDPIPGAAGQIAGLVYAGFDRVVTLGPRPDVRLEEAYIHL